MPGVTALILLFFFFFFFLFFSLGSCVCYSSTCMYVLGASEIMVAAVAFAAVVVGCYMSTTSRRIIRLVVKGSIYWFVTLCVGHRRVQSSLWLLEENIHTMEKREEEKEIIYELRRKGERQRRTDERAGI